MGIDLTSEEEERKNRCCFPAAGRAPWLVYSHGASRKKKIQTFCTISSSSSSPYTECCFKSIPQLRGRYIFSSHGEWLVLRDTHDSKSFSLWNTISSQVIHLPPLDSLDDEDQVYISCALVLPPNCKHDNDVDGDDDDPPNCKHDNDVDGDDNDSCSVFLFGDGVVFCYHPLRNKDSWLVQSFEFHVRDVIPCNGIIYAHTTRGPLGIIEFNDDGSSLRLRPLELPHPDKYVANFKHYLESCGKLYLVVVHIRYSGAPLIYEVSVWELDLKLMKWVQVKCLGGRSFFVGRQSSSWCWGDTHHGESSGIKGNSVYFFGGAEYGTLDALYLYNLEDGTLTSILPCPNLPAMYYSYHWVMPPHQRLKGEDTHKHKEEKVGSLGLGCDATPSLGQKENKMVEIFPLCEFPYDLISSVARHLHLFDYLNFRSSCKLLSDVVPIARWRTNNSCPLLMFFENEDPLCRLVDPFRIGSCDMVLPESYRGTVHLEFSKDGWLVIGLEHCLEFFNPFTGVRGEYPPLVLFDLETIGFSTSPTSSDCVTVGMYWCTDEITNEIAICYHIWGEEMWHFCVFPQHEHTYLHGVCRPVYLKGAFYFLDREGRLGVFKLIDGEGKWDVYDKPRMPQGDRLHSVHLVECDGELISVIIEEFGDRVGVFKLELPKMKWVPVKTLGNHTLFIGHPSAFATVATELEMRNRIYVARWRDSGILFYSLDTGKYGTLKGDEWLEDFSGTKELTRCCWL